MGVVVSSTGDLAEHRAALAGLGALSYRLEDVTPACAPRVAPSLLDGLEVEILDPSSPVTMTRPILLVPTSASPSDPGSADPDLSD